MSVETRRTTIFGIPVEEWRTPDDGSYLFKLDEQVIETKKLCGSPWFIESVRAVGDTLEVDIRELALPREPGDPYTHNLYDRRLMVLTPENINEISKRGRFQFPSHTFGCMNSARFRS